MSNNGKRKSRTKSGSPAATPQVGAPPAGAGAVALAGDASTGGAVRGSSAQVEQPARGSVPEGDSTPMPHVDLALLEAARETAASAGGEAAAVRDDSGRLHTATAITVPSLRTSPVRAAAMSAVLSGATTLQAAVVVSDAVTPADSDLAALRDLGGPGMPIVLVGADGAVRTRTPV